MKAKEIILKGVRVHNLKNVDLVLKANQLIVFTGVSGSGKSSLAFDTIYVEGQRRYIESLSTYARRHLGEMAKPEAKLISGISPSIAIEQKTAGKNPRSTVGTLTGIYDYLRVLFARIGSPHCPISGEKVSPQSAAQILAEVLKLPEGTKVIFLSPYCRGKKAEFKEEFAHLLRRGFMRIRLDSKIVELSNEISVDGKVAHDIDLVIDRLSIKAEERSRIAEAVSHALEEGKGVMSILHVETNEETLYSEHAFSAKSGLSYGPLEPHDFSFNHPAGMCDTCQGLGIIQEFDLEKVINPKLSIAEDCCLVASSYKTVRYGNIYDNLAKLHNFSVDTPWKKLSEKAKNVLLYGTKQKWTRMRFVHPIKKTSWTDFVHWRGILFEARQRYQEATSDVYRNKLRPLLQESICPSCKGAKIKPYPAAALLEKLRIHEITALPVRECLAFFKNLKLSQDKQLIADELLKEIKERLGFLENVGLHYLTLDRTAPTLSGGEAQRVRLASQIGSGLVGATYVLDEPSIGLHPRDNHKLLETLKTLRDKGNTVIVVEHDEETIAAADCIVDIGPLAGEKGGEILSNGSLKELLNCKASLTAAFLSGREEIPIPKKRKKSTKGFLEIQKASHHNLKNISVKIPVGLFVAVTGVSGSGKSSLITDILYPALSNRLQGSHLPIGKHKAVIGQELLDKVIAIDQTPIGRTPRSNPATYIKLFDEIRDLFCQLPESAAAGFAPGRFSFNVKEGSCPHCGGMGMIKIDMDFMEDAWTSCTICKGKRFDEKTLSIHYRGKNIHDVLEMTVEEAFHFFKSIPKIKEKLEMLLQVGLDYIRLGQSSPTLSGGEAQRIKLAKELSRKDTGNTLYLLDEPTTGLHFYDIKKLLVVLQALVDKGNTVLVIEHNMDLVKTADWIIDLGPEGGKEGGNLIAEDTPEKIAKLKTPTGAALKAALFPKRPPSSLKTVKTASLEEGKIFVKGACQNNLKNINTSFERGKIILCTGPSGSGKTSFAFETIYAEGQRRYIETLSAYARQFVKQMPKPKVESIEGLSASIAIEQKSHAENPRSTVGTMTEAYDFLRVLFAHLGIAYAPETGERIQTISKEYVADVLLRLPKQTRLYILAPLTLKREENFEQLKSRLQSQGFLRLRLNKTYYELEENIPFDPRGKNELQLVIDRLVVEAGIRGRLLEAIEQASSRADGMLIADTGEKDLFFNLTFTAPSTGKSYAPLTPHSFSFNTEQGMCPDCLGLGFQYGADLTQFPELMQLTPSGLLEKLSFDFPFEKFLDELSIDADVPLEEQPRDKLQIFLQGSKTEIKTKKGLKVSWNGINPTLAKAAKAAFFEIKEALAPLLNQSTCLSCDGTRLNLLARHVKVEGKTLPELCSMSLEETASFIKHLKLSEQESFLQETLDQLNSRLHFLNAIGLHYLSLGRSAPSLSGGESQRIRLARQLGSGLTGCLYVLDEPTIGLHPHNNNLLNQALDQLRALGNTLLLVEHDPMTIALADYVFDFGPGAGKEGGDIVAQGTLKEILSNPKSLTGLYLSGKKKIPIPDKRRTSSSFVTIKNASLHNLKNIDVSFPKTAFSCITGVSGSGKSSLMEEVVKHAKDFDKVISLQQSPLGQTIRADVSSYVDLLTPLRYFFASLPAAKAKGLQPRHFSSNHKKGMCSACRGLGFKIVDLQFLPSVRVPCASCHGFRLNPLSLTIETKGKHLGQVLEMTVSEAKSWLIPIPKAIRILDTLISVGLGYLRLNQEVSSLSGGEAQRLRLSRELSKRTVAETLYLFDEPTIGLHSEDILKLLAIFHALVDKGHTVILIEHNLDVIASSDFIVDLGPDAGEKGGTVVAFGTPEEVALSQNSHTAVYLKPLLTKEKQG